MTAELRILSPGTPGLRSPLYEEDAPRVAEVLPRHLQLIADEYGRATAVVVKGNVFYLILSARRQ